jgi:hypothetical protein
MKQKITEELLTVQGGCFYSGSVAVIKGVEAVSNNSTVTLRVVGGDEKEVSTLRE